LIALISTEKRKPDLENREQRTENREKRTVRVYPEFCVFEK
jgi:hypothetical protein